MLSWVCGWMGRVSFGGAVLIASLAAASQETITLRALVGHTLTGRVTTVVDGDTVDVRLETGRLVRVRLEGIDAPERGRPFFAQSRAATRVALFDKAVTLRATDVDRYQRLVARVMAGGHDSSVDLVQAGLACQFTIYSSDPSLAAAQADARSHGRGFWAAGGQRPATCSYAASARAPAPRSEPSNAAKLVAAEFHGNRRSKVYHQASCRNYNCSNCVVVFHSHEEAAAAGFRPAGDCFPK